MREKYTDNIGYLFKRDKSDNTIAYSQMGIPFYFNREIKTKQSLDPMTGVKMASTIEILKSTTQISFEENDRVAFVSNPTEDDYEMMITVIPKPLLGRGNKHGQIHNEYWITIT